MTATVSRLQLLRGEVGRGSRAIRPPRSLAEGLFVETCDRTGACIKACQPGIIAKGRGGFPIIDFTKGECTFCMNCVRACHSGALDRKTLGKTDFTWPVKAGFTDACIASQGVTCRTCGEFCEPSAIRFRLVVGGGALPEIDLSACTGCGACVAPCPVGAIKLGYQY